MDPTVIVAVVGLVSTLIAGWFAAFWERRGAREDRMLEARVRLYGEAAQALYEYERLTYKRARNRLATPDADRASLREDAYRANYLAKASIGQVALISGREGLMEGFEEARRAIDAMTRTESQVDLKRKKEEATQIISLVLKAARVDLNARSARMWLKRNWQRISSAT